MLILNSCVGSPGIIPRDTPSFLGMDAWMTSQLNVALIRKLLIVLLLCLAHFLTCYPWVCVQHALADVPLTVAAMQGLNMYVYI